MNKFLLPLAACAFTLAASAEVPAAPRGERAKVVARQVSLHAPLKADIKGNKLRKSINPRKVDAADATYRLYESFEDVVENPIHAPLAYGLPEGWSSDALLDVNNLGPNGAIPTCWYVTSQQYAQTSYDGYYLAISPCLTGEEKAVSLISPEFTPLAGDELSLSIYFQPIRLFKGFEAWHTGVANEYIDGEDGLILKREANENVEVLISTDGGTTWNPLYNAFEEYSEKGYWDMMDYHAAQTWYTLNLSLTEYAGQNVKVAVRHTNYEDGGGIAVDLVTVAPPAITTSYLPSLPAYFWAYDLDMYGYYGRMAAPMYTPVAFESDDYESNLSWSVADPLDPEVTLTGEGDIFEVTYKPDYRKYGPNGTYTWQQYPTLTATREGATPGIYNYGQDFAFGAGCVVPTGRASLYDSETGEVDPDFNYGMFNFDPTRGVNVLTFDGIGTPVFGFSGDSRTSWTDHFFGNEAEPEDYAECSAIMNFFYPIVDRPMVIHGVRVYGLGKFINPDAANLTLDLVQLNEDFVPTTVLRSATLTGSQAISLDYHDYAYPYLVFDFKFDEPLVFDGFNMIARFSGFNDAENVEFFAPLQSDLPDPRWCNAFGAVTLYAPSLGATTPAETFVPSANFQGELGDAFSSFVMSLDAEMPWLESEETEFSATTEEPNHVFIIDSWHNASKLTVKANTADGKLPAWITKAEVAGEKGTATFTVETLPAEEAENCVLTVEGPGVMREFTINQAQGTGIDGVAADADKNGALRHYDLQGRSIDADAEGVHVTSEGKFLKK